jgi:hypothetical protein
MKYFRFIWFPKTKKMKPTKAALRCIAISNVQPQFQLESNVSKT